MPAGSVKSKTMLECDDRRSHQQINYPVAAGYVEKSMGKLMKASAWSKREFEAGSQPDNRTIKKWVMNGQLQGRIVDGSVWVLSSESWGVSSVVSSAVHHLIHEA